MQDAPASSSDEDEDAIGEAPAPAPALPPPPPSPPTGARDAGVRIHVVVPFADACGMLVAAATLTTLEMHDAALMAEAAGEVYDPSTDAPEGIFWRYGVLVNECGAASPYSLCATPNPEFKETDVMQARERMGAWGKPLGVTYFEGMPPVLREDINVGDLRGFAETLGLPLPDDARRRLGALVKKHAPWPAETGRADRDIKRLERLASAFTLKYDESPASKRARTDESPLRA